MKHVRLRTATLLAVGCALILSASAVAQGSDEITFAEPVRIKAGDGFAGEGRLYPSPVLHDVDGDQRPDLVIGDLIGKVTFGSRARDKGVVFAAEQPLKGADGKPLKFHNW